MSANKSVLIIGKPASGKTTFLAQFLTRVTKGKSKVKLVSMPENIKAISDAQRSLAAGEEPATTQSDRNVELNLSLDINGNNIQLSCPDYGGEQISAQTELMEVDTKWQERVKDSNNWILFIRASKISPEYDLSITSYENIEKDKSSAHKELVLSEQSLYIELIQSLLFAKEVGIRKEKELPKLVVVITCWDELSSELTPKEVLIEKLPMFNNVIESIWNGQKLSVIGLSAQEFSLKGDIEASDRYLDDLPESFGYMVTEEGNKDKDITHLIDWALQ
jgi:energy-coupling factor transporter ATP-binding protein EcfA2